MTPDTFHATISGSGSPSPIPSELIDCLSYLTPQERAELDRLLGSESWLPLPGPQSAAFHSPADVLLYGGGAGGGKTELLLGLALTGHRRSILFRREFQQLRAIEDRADSLINGPMGCQGRYNAQRRIWRLDDGRILEFGAVQHPGDERKYQGRPHDLKAFDEITHFTERQFRFLTGWNRTTEPDQRVRVVAAGNPPLEAEGDWVIRHWAPWLDAQHPNPARSGELRWFVHLGGEEREVEDAAPIMFKGERVAPKSRCFIRARVEDNPYLMAAGYKAVLQSLPEPLRSQMLEGDFSVGRDDDAFQIIPTGWVEAAMARGKAEPIPPGPITVLGVDVARGGQDRTVLSPRHGNWFGPQTVLPGRATPDGPSVLGHCLAVMAPWTSTSRPVMQVDVIGIGAAVYDAARSHGYEILALNGAEASSARDRTGRLGFVNARAAWWWSLREALDPDQGDGLVLPPDRELLADLTAPRWTLAARGIQVEGKDEIRARLGRSPDKGDSLVYAHAKVMAPGAGLLAFMREAAGG